LLRRLVVFCVVGLTPPPAAVGNIQADPGQIEQVILNLSINARDAMPNGGQLSIESSLQQFDPAGAQPLSLSPGTYVQFTFRDTGCGMDEATKARIFEPFFTTKAPGVGTGLGLSTALGIVEQSGGSITVASETGCGASFKIYLPLAEDQSDRLEQRQLPDDASADEVILLVEDSDSIRGFAREVLEGQGYRVLEAASPEEAFTVAELSPVVDLLLADVVMSGMNGDQLADRLSALRPGLKVLYMSGSPQAGNTNMIAKPLQAPELLSKTSEVLARKTARAKLLIVEDDQQVRSFLATLMEAEGYAVLQASNGKEAQVYCQETLPDLVITDLVMPEQEGLETIHAIGRDWPHMPIIAISGAFGGAFLEPAKKMGADAVLRKPFEAHVILSEVRRLIAQ
jgi:CheY-like chemotaxis protein